MANATLRTKPPTLPTCSPESLAIFVIDRTNTANAAPKTIPLNISPASNMSTSLITTTISSIATASFFIKLPTLSICSEPAVSLPSAHINTSIPAAMPAKPRKPCLASSGSIEPIILTITAISKSATPIWSKPCFNPSSLSPFFKSKLAPALDILSSAKARPISTPPNTAIIATAFHILPTSSIWVRTQMAATRIAIEMASLCRAFAFRSHE